MGQCSKAEGLKFCAIQLKGVSCYEHDKLFHRNWCWQGMARCKGLYYGADVGCDDFIYGKTVRISPLTISTTEHLSPQLQQLGLSCDGIWDLQTDQIIRSQAQHPKIVHNVF